jgi:hypothetical protein
MTTTLLTVELVDDNGARRLSWNTGDPTVSVGAQHLDEMIGTLARLREQIAPPVSIGDPAPDVPPEAKIDPQWWIGPETFVGGAMLKIRHPGLGWLAFAIPLDNLHKLHAGIGTLVKWAEERAAGQSAN